MRGLVKLERRASWDFGPFDARTAGEPVDADEIGSRDRIAGGGFLRIDGLPVIGARGRVAWRGEDAAAGQWNELVALRGELTLAVEGKIRQRRIDRAGNRVGVGRKRNDLRAPGVDVVELWHVDGVAGWKGRRGKGIAEFPDRDENLVRQRLPLDEIVARGPPWLIACAPRHEQRIVRQLA